MRGFWAPVAYRTGVGKDVHERCLCWSLLATLGNPTPLELKNWMRAELAATRSTKILPSSLGDLVLI